MTVAAEDQQLGVVPRGSIVMLGTRGRNLVHIQGMTQAEAADMLGVAPETVKRRLDSRGSQKI